MDAATCLRKLQYVGVLAFATVDETGTPQVRNISAIHYEKDEIYFLPPEGRTSAGNCSQTGGCRCSDIRNIRK